MENKYTSHITKGSYIAIAYIFLNTFLFYSKTKSGTLTDFVAWALIILGTCLSVYYFSKFTNDKQTFGSLFAHGFKTAAVSTCFIFIYMIAMVYVVDKNKSIETVNALVDAARKANPATFDEKAAKENFPNALKVTRIMLLAFTVMGNLFLGVIGSVIGAVFSSKQIRN